MVGVKDCPRALFRRAGADVLVSRDDASFAPDGKHIVTASDDGTVRTYACAVCGSVYELARLAHAQLVRTAALLTPRERRRYFGG